MKKLKSSLILISALSLCTSIFTALPAQAEIAPLPKVFTMGVDKTVELDSEYYSEMLAMCNKIDYSGIDYMNGYEIFQSKDYPHLFYSYKIEKNRFTLQIKPEKDGDISVIDEKINSYLKEINSSYTIDSYFFDKSNRWVYNIFLDSENMNQDTLTDAKKICAELKKENLISDFIYNGDYTGDAHICKGHYLTSYHYNNDEKRDKMIETLKKYVSENNLDCSVVYTDKIIQVPMEVPEDIEPVLVDRYIDSEGIIPVSLTHECVCVVPNHETSDYEYSKLAQKIYEDLGGTDYIPDFSAEQSGNTVSFYTKKTDIFNLGNTNNDSKVDIADVVTISAYVASPESNPINSEQQILNGDVHNTGDGLTSGDILMIQQYLAGLIEYL